MTKMVKQSSDDALCVPLFNIPYSLIYNNIPGLAYHTKFCTPAEASTWRVYNDWTDKTK